jgi:hypothetical protein
MPHRSTHKHAFGPRELTKLALAFDGAWQQLCVEGVEAKTVEQIELTRTKLAQWIFNYATNGHARRGRAAVERARPTWRSKVCGTRG